MRELTSDLYSRVARKVFRKSRITAEQRQLVKVCFFTTLREASRSSRPGVPRISVKFGQAEIPLQIDAKVYRDS